MMKNLWYVILKIKKKWRRVTRVHSIIIIINFINMGTSIFIITVKVFYLQMGVSFSPCYITLIFFQPGYYHLYKLMPHHLKLSYC